MTKNVMLAVLLLFLSLIATLPADPPPTNSVSDLANKALDAANKTAGDWSSAKAWSGYGSGITDKTLPNQSSPAFPTDFPTVVKSDPDKGVNCVGFSFYVVWTVLENAKAFTFDTSDAAAKKAMADKLAAFYETWYFAPKNDAAVPNSNGKGLVDALVNAKWGEEIQLNKIAKGCFVFFRATSPTDGENGIYHTGIVSDVKLTAGNVTSFQFVGADKINPLAPDGPTVAIKNLWVSITDPPAGPENLTCDKDFFYAAQLNLTPPAAPEAAHAP
jgi:hypothetical protein